MKYYKKLSIISLFALTLCGTATAQNFLEPESDRQLVIEMTVEDPLDFTDEVGISPQISKGSEGDLLVAFMPTWFTEISKARLYNFTKGIEIPVFSNSLKQYHVAISGDKLACRALSDRNAYDDGIHVFDIQTQTEIANPNGPVSQDFPRITYDGGVAYIGQDGIGGNQPKNVYYWNSVSGEWKQITNYSSGGPLRCDISGSWIVWSVYEREERVSRIYAYNLTTETVQLISTSIIGFTVGELNIDGNKIVYTKYVFGAATNNVYLYDLETNEEQIVYPSATGQANPKIQGNKVVWNDRFYDNRRVYCFDLTTQNLQVLTTGFPIQSNPAVYDDEIDSQVIWLSLADPDTGDPSGIYTKSVR